MLQAVSSDVKARRLFYIIGYFCSALLTVPHAAGRLLRRQGTLAVFLLLLFCCTFFTQFRMLLAVATQLLAGCASPPLATMRTAHRGGLPRLLSRSLRCRPAPRCRRRPSSLARKLATVARCRLPSTRAASPRCVLWPQVRAIRHGREAELPVREVLVGDVLLVETGDILCTDGLLVAGCDVK